MINVGKYMAAARGADNVAAKATNIKNPVEMALHRSAKAGSRAGLDDSKSAWIQMDGAGYHKRPQRNPIGEFRSPVMFASTSNSRSFSKSVRKPNYSRVTGDQDLSRLI